MINAIWKSFVETAKQLTNAIVEEMISVELKRVEAQKSRKPIYELPAFLMTRSNFQ
ncbi:MULTISPECIES: hypothetical protein [Sporosarcina]|uniref:Transposase n=1 Tax=Sporosarcina contaminans TaxID=633403 RepID=A0ABW3U2E1_9BACL